MSMSWAFLDQWAPIEPKQGAAIGGLIYGMSPFLHKDMAVCIVKYISHI